MLLNAAEVILARSMEPAIRVRPAIYCNGVVVTYAELHALVNRAANAFGGLGVVQGERVPLLLDDGPLYAACLLGLMKIGAVPIPLNTRLKAEAGANDNSLCDHYRRLHKPQLPGVHLSYFCRPTKQCRRSQCGELLPATAPGQEHSPSFQITPPSP